VFGRGVGRVRSGRALGRQLQDARPLRGEHTLIGWHAAFVEFVEVRHQRYHAKPGSPSEESLRLLASLAI
jgi:hypothetical protein